MPGLEDMDAKMEKKVKGHLARMGVQGMKKTMSTLLKHNLINRIGAIVTTLSSQLKRCPEKVGDKL
jgi:hypothetical protein